MGALTPSEHPSGPAEKVSRGLLWLLDGVSVGGSRDRNASVKQATLDLRTAPGGVLTSGPSGLPGEVKGQGRAVGVILLLLN